MENSISRQNVNVNVRAVVTDPNVTVQYKTKILHKNIVNGVNTLTQEMMSAQNTKYVVKYDYTLATDITIPANCILEFDGGSISGEHTITGTNTGIDADLIKIFNTDVTLSGTWKATEVYPEWFGAKADGVTDDTDAILKSLNINATTIVFDKGIYCVSNTITLLYSNMQIKKHATIKAIADMDYMIIVDRSHFPHTLYELDYNVEMSGGGTIDGNSHAKVGVCPKWVVVFNINNLIIKGTVFYGYVAMYIDFDNDQISEYNSGHTLMNKVYVLNTSTLLSSTYYVSIDIVNSSTNTTRKHHNYILVGTSADANSYINNYKTRNPLGANEKYITRVLNGNVGIVANRSDSIYEDVFLTDYIIGVGSYTDSYFKNVHPWILHSENYPNSISFDVYSLTHILNCEADTMQYLVNLRDSFSKIDITGGNVYCNAVVVDDDLYTLYPQAVIKLNETKYNSIRINSTVVDRDAPIFIGEYVDDTLRSSKVNLPYINNGQSNGKPSSNLSNGSPYYNRDLDTIEFWFNGEWKRSEGVDALYSMYKVVGNNHLFKILDIPQNYRAVAAKIRFCYAGTEYDEITIDAGYYGSNRVRVETDVDFSNFDVYIKDNSVYLLCKNNGAIFVLSQTRPKYITDGGVTIDYTKVTSGICSHYGTFANKPSQNFIKPGFRYFCTDKQTAEGATDGIEIIYKGEGVWVDALGRTIS